MGLFRNAVDAMLIVACFYAGSITIGFFGLDFAKSEIFSFPGVAVSLLLAFMETTYNRF